MANQQKNPRRDPGGLIILCLISMGTLFLLFTGTQTFIKQIAFMDQAFTAHGTVASFIEKSRHNASSQQWVTERYPLITFNPLDGKLVHYQLNEISPYKMGDSLPILYLEKPPFAPIIDDFEHLWQPSVFRLGFGLVLLLISLKSPIWRKTSLMTRLKSQSRKK